MRERPKSLMIFAAGHGTRMAPLTNSIPKPLIKVGGRALIDHALELADGLETVVVNTHHLADRMDAASAWNGRCDSVRGNPAGNRRRTSQCASLFGRRRGF